ncbi:hypothetical protein Goshw_009019, partial [Gossypium schwendimanii]|nr:hypothetical protein [Gossypium schwendimanii]
KGDNVFSLVVEAQAAVLEDQICEIPKCKKEKPMKKRSKKITSAINGRETSERMKLDEGRKRLPLFPLVFLSRCKKRKNGGAIREPNGGWLVGFGMVTGLTDIFQVEVRAMLEGLKIAWAYGFHQVEAESDNALLVDIL